MTRIVFDIGGTNMRVARESSGAAGSLGEMKKVPTPQSQSEAFAALTDLIAEVSDGEPVTAIAGGVAGIIGPSGEIINSPNLPYWTGFTLGTRLEKKYSVPVRIANDTDLAGLGEAHRGAGQSATIVVYLGIGTGVGGTRIVDGSISRHTFGFEAGHQIMDVPSHATLESLIGGRSLETKHKTPPSKLPRNVWDELTPVLATGIWNSIVHWSPQVVVLGGSLMNEENGFRIDDITQALSAIPSIYPALPYVRHSLLGEQSGLYGALTLVRH